MQHTQPQLLRDNTTSLHCAGCEKPALDRRCEHCGCVSRAGDYRVERVINQSPRGRMYLAVDASGQRVALKELVFANAPTSAHIDAFEREATLLRQLDHPGIPRFVSAFHEGSGAHMRFYLAQEYVGGQSLADELTEHRFSDEEAREVLNEMLEVLEYLHSRSPRLIHRDIKPANIIRRDNGELVLVDFDTAREVGVEGTHRSTLVGTFGYMPLEQLGGTVDATSDLYALGATLLHVLTRRPPHELLDESLQLTPGRLANISAGLREVLERMLHPRRSARFQTVADVQRGLNNTSVPEFLPSIQISTARAWSIVGAFVVACAAAFFLTRASSGHDTPYIAEPAPSGAQYVPEPAEARPTPVPVERTVPPKAIAPEDIQRSAMEFLQGGPPAPSRTLLAENFAFPSEKQRVLTVTIESVFWADRQPLSLLERLPNNERWLGLNVTVTKHGRGTADFQPARQLNVIDVKGKAVHLLPVGLSSRDPNSAERITEKVMSTLFMNQGDSGTMDVGARVRLEDGPFDLVLPDKKKVRLDVNLVHVVPR